MEMIKAIDVHSHYNHGSIYDTKTNDVYSAELAFLEMERKKLCVEKMAVCSFASVLSDKEVEEENERAMKLYQKCGFTVLPYIEMKK